MFGICYERLERFKTFQMSLSVFNVLFFEDIRDIKDMSEMFEDVWDRHDTRDKSRSRNGRCLYVPSGHINISEMSHGDCVPIRYISYGGARIICVEVDKKDRDPFL